MKIYKSAVSCAIVIGSLCLSGCATHVIPLGFSVSNVGISKHKIDAEMKSLTVTTASEDEKSGKINMNPIVPELWKTAITEALNETAIFQDDSPRKVSLSVKILQFDPDTFGANMATRTKARYEILDRKSGEVLYTQEVASIGEVSFDYAFLGVSRMNESANRAVRNNITSFLKAVETVDMDKPAPRSAMGARQY